MRSGVETAEAVRRGEVKAMEVLDQSLAAIETANPELNAFVHVDAEGARRVAESIDARVARGEDPGPLAGVPIGVKDLEDCAGMPTSQGSLLFKGRGPVAEDSWHVARLRSAGAVPVGKTAAPEFGITCFTSTKAWGTTRNPWHRELTPGGSSGGSAAAVAGGMVPMCTASDGGGSTRIPASYCGLVGLKPSFGRIAYSRPSPSQTVAYGALVTTVADAARHLDVAAGPDDRDRTSLPAPQLCYERSIEELDLRGLSATWSADFGFAVVDPEVASVARAAAEDLVTAAQLRWVERPFAPHDLVLTWLAASGMDLWMGLEEGMWPWRADELTELVRSALSATEHVTLDRLVQSQLRRYDLDEQVAGLFADVDVLLAPTTASVAFGAEGPLPMVIDGRDAPMGPVPFTMLANLTGNPAISVPAGLTDAGLPVGLQVIGRRHADEVVLRLARILEQARPWPRTAPLLG